MRIVFLGTPDFAVPTLKALVESKHEVLAVVTQPDKKRDRNVISFSPVKEEALKHNLEVLQYEKIKVEGIEDLKRLNPDVMVTCAYGQIISQEILDIPKFGVINVHASLLPKYRGSSPIQWAIINGESQTGITIMKTALGVDSGDIILQKKIDIKENETAGELFDRLSQIGPEALLEALDLIEQGKAVFTPQDESKATHVSMLKKEDGHIDWSKKAIEIKNQVYGMNPWPSAFSYFNKKLFKIWTCDIEPMKLDYPNGYMFIKDKKVFVKCSDGAIELKEVQIEGKKRMTSQAFILGNEIEGVILE
ncbi:MAG: methionyl-tRNA formyltransferase [Christensenella sp.]|nr:methionyl-tRNA formyltransferase [Christensenella sp.]